ncbi:MAG TPA: transcriptional regulator [Catalimonadaceae bacterium]|nr:transcriptional regulator [Catalimonadaceae bacterium]
MQIKSTESLGQFVRETRKAIGVTQKDLALSSGTGLRFIIDLERGKPTCQIGKVFHILHNLGVRVEVTSPVPFQTENTR